MIEIGNWMGVRRYQGGVANLFQHDFPHNHFQKFPSPWLVPTFHHHMEVWLNKETSLDHVAHILYNAVHQWNNHMLRSELWTDLTFALCIVMHRWYIVILPVDGGIAQAEYTSTSHSVVKNCYQIDSKRLTPCKKWLV